MPRWPLPLPSAGEAQLYLKSHGLGRASRKFIAAYVVGREHWYLTIEDLHRWIGEDLASQGLEIRAATAADMSRMAPLTERQHPNTLRAWCEDDHVFFIALADGQAVSYRCVSRVVHPVVAAALTLGASQVFMVDEFTVPAYRRRGITRQLAIATNPVLLEAGYREVVGVHRVDNTNTIAATRAKGIVTIGRLTRACLLSHTRFTWEPYVTTVPAPVTPAVRRKRGIADLLDGVARTARVV